MKHFIYALGVILGALCICGSAHAILISESVYSTIYSVEGGGSEIVVGDMVHLFDVVYDDEGVAMHDYSDLDDSVNHEYTIDDDLAGDHSFGWLDDATFTLSKFVTGLVMSYGGRDVFNSYSDHVYRYDTSSNSSVNYYTFHDDYRLSFYTRDSSYTSGDLRVHGDDDSTLIVNFRVPTSITEGPSGTVPEPATMLLLGAGFAGLAIYRRRVKK